MYYSAEDVRGVYRKSLEDGSVFPLGYRYIDSALGGGLRKGQMLVFGSLDNVGKSRFCLTSMLARSDLGQGSLMISLEDGQDEIGRRVAKTGAKKGCYFSFPVPTADAVCDTIIKSPEDVSMVYLDFIQEMGDNDTGIIAGNLRAVNQACKEREVALVVASQCTTRPSEDAFPEPNRNWLRGSASLRIKAHMVVMAWFSAESVISSKICKNKSGRVGDRVVLKPANGGVTLKEVIPHEEEEELFL